MAKNKRAAIKGRLAEDRIKDKFKAEQLLKISEKGEARLEEKKTELIKAKETYYRLCSEFIDLWSKTKRAQRGA